MACSRVFHLQSFKAFWGNGDVEQKSVKSFLQH